MKTMFANYRVSFSFTLISLLLCANVHAAEITVAAANSSCMALNKIALIYKEQHGTTVHYICKSSGRLAKGLKGKAIEADLYISANKAWMDEMVKADVVAASSVRDMWGNSLVVVAPQGDPIKLDRWSELGGDKVKTLLIGDPGTAPFGRYAKQSLQSTGIWDAVKGKIVTKRHVTLLAETVAASEHGTVGILFRTNVHHGMKVLYTLDKAWHDPIRYYGALVTASASRDAASDFMRFLQGARASKVLGDAGFELLAY